MESQQPAAVRVQGNKPKLGNRFGPESRFYDRLKGKQVKIVWNGQDWSLQATLLFVDRYSLGVRMSDGNEVLVYKHWIQTIGLANADA